MTIYFFCLESLAFWCLGKDLESTAHASFYFILCISNFLNFIFSLEILYLSTISLSLQLPNIIGRVVNRGKATVMEILLFLLQLSF